MKPHASPYRHLPVASRSGLTHRGEVPPAVAGGRFSFCSSVGLMLLVSACSTLGPPSDRGPVSEVTEPASVVVSEVPEPGGGINSRHSASSGAKRGANGSGKRLTLPPRPALSASAGTGERSGLGQPDPALQALIDGVGEGDAFASVPIAGPTPKLERLAAQANRPYRLRGRKYRPMTELKPFKQRGVASWYGKPFHGRRTAIGERYDMHSMSAAHPTLPLPSYVKVTNLKSGSSVIVRVNDRGPFAQDRIIDLSHAAAKELGIVKGGIAAVELNLIVPEPAGTESPAPVADVSR